MGQILYALKKYYFAVNMVTASTAAVATAGIVTTSVENSLETGQAIVQQKPRQEKNRRVVERASLSDYGSILSGNLLRDSAAAVTETGESVNPTDLTLVGTVSGPWKFQMATFQVKGEKTTQEFPAGSKIGDYRIVWIGRETVWVKDANGEKIKITVDSKLEPTDNNSKSKASESKSTAGGLVKKVISREKINRLLKNPRKLYRGIAMGPFMKGNKIVGYKLKRVRKKHFFYELGARSGDVITRVNGQDFGKMDKMLQIWGEVKTADKIVIDLERKKVPTTYEIHIK